MSVGKVVTRIEVVEVPERFYMKVGTASRYAGFSPNTLRKYTDLGFIRAKILPSGDRLYCKEWLDEFVENLPDAVESGKRRISTRGEHIIQYVINAGRMAHVSHGYAPTGRRQGNCSIALTSQLPREAGGSLRRSSSFETEDSLLGKLSLVL